LSYNADTVSTRPIPNPIGYLSNFWNTIYQDVLTEAQTLRVTIAANASLNAYILEVSSSTIDDRISRKYSWSVDFSNVTHLDLFLDSHSGVIGSQGEINNDTIIFEYTPTRIVDISFAVPTAAGTLWVSGPMSCGGSAAWLQSATCRRSPNLLSQLESRSPCST
jgi:hypothetical protein